MTATRAGSCNVAMGRHRTTGARRAGVLAAVVALAGGAIAREAHAQTDALASADLSAGVEIQRSALDRIGAPGGLLMVRDGAGVRQLIAFGLADIQSGRAASTGDVWRIASVTKLVTAVVVLQLAREKTLALDDTVAKYLPGVVPNAQKITIRQLLDHTSGIPDYLAGPGSPPNVSATRLKGELVRRRAFAALIEDANRQRRTARPGETHDYSNTNYLLLERIIEKATRNSFEHEVRTRILQPAGLSMTGFPSKTGRVPHRQLKGYVPADTRRGPFTAKKTLVDVTTHDYVLGADGGLYSSLDDLSRLLDAIWSGPLLTDGERQAMIANAQYDHDGTYRYGLGVAAYKLPCNKTVYGHVGRDLGIYTLALSDRKRRRHLVLAINKPIDDRGEMERRIYKLRDQAFCKGT
jgi:D-alanyl-D-alanine carboxypeptidase